MSPWHFVTALHFLAEYQRALSALTGELSALERRVHDAVATSLWQMNGAQTEALLDDLLLMPIIEGAEIHNPNGEVTFKRRSYGVADRPLEMLYVEKPLLWSASGREVNLGALRLYSSSSVILDRVLFVFFVVGLGAILKFSLRWWLFFWAFRRFLGVPLAQLMSQIREIQLDTIDDKRIDLPGQERNELSQLQDSINAMLEANKELKWIASTDYLTKTDNRCIAIWDRDRPAIDGSAQGAYLVRYGIRHDLMQKGFEDTHHQTLCVNRK